METTFIINKETGQWGTNTRKQDLVRVKGKTEKRPLLLKKINLRNRSEWKGVTSLGR